MLRTEFIKFDDKLFVLKRKIHEHQNPNVDAWKEHLRADTVLKKDGLLYFLELVPELEEIKEAEVVETPQLQEQIQEQI
jgi:hypothetical protein